MEGRKTEGFREKTSTEQECKTDNRLNLHVSQVRKSNQSKSVERQGLDSAPVLLPYKTL